MRSLRIVSVLVSVLCVAIICITPVLAGEPLSLYPTGGHWASAELLELGQKLEPLIAVEDRHDTTGEHDGEIIREFVLKEENLDKPIKAEHWAALLNVVLDLPVEDKKQLLDMYVFGLATGDEMTREDAVGGMVKLLTIRHLSGQVTAEEVEPAKALRDLDAISEQQDVLVRVAYCHGLLDSQTTEYFRPKDTLLTGEAISMMCRVIKAFDITYPATAKPVDEDLPRPTSGDWVMAELQQYRDASQRKAVALKTAEAILLTGPGMPDEIANSPVALEQWTEALKLTLDIQDEVVLHTYTSGLVPGPTITRDAAVVGLVKLLHHKGLVEARDASEAEMLSLASAFDDYAAAFDISKLAIAYSEGLIKGYPDHTFRPVQEITKGEALILMLNVIKKYF